MDIMPKQPKAVALWGGHYVLIPAVSSATADTVRAQCEVNALIAKINLSIAAKQAAARKSEANLLRAQRHKAIQQIGAGLVDKPWRVLQTVVHGFARVSCAVSKSYDDAHRQIRDAGLIQVPVSRYSTGVFGLAVAIDEGRRLRTAQAKAPVPEPVPAAREQTPFIPAFVAEIGPTYPETRFDAVRRLAGLDKKG